MFRANVYSLETLTSVAREAINDGIGIIAAYMGQTVTPREVRVRLPLDETGSVNPDRIGFGNLDRLIELHVLAVPLAPSDNRKGGLAGAGRGLVFVNTTENDAKIICTSTVHEVGHAFGFVRPAAKQADQESPMHCCDKDCIMHKEVEVLKTVPEPTRQPTGMRRLLSRSTFSQRNLPELPWYELNGQDDLCLPCKSDLREYGEVALSRLRADRIFNPQAMAHPITVRSAE